MNPFVSNVIQCDYHIGVEKRNDILSQVLIQHN